MNRQPWVFTGIIVASVAVLLISFRCGAENIESDTSPEEVAFAFKATEWKRVTSMVMFKDNLYMGACEAPTQHSSGDVIVYDDATGAVEKIYSVQEQGLQKIRVFGDKLIIPGTDSTLDSNIGNIYIFDGENWTMKSTVGGDRSVAHVMDIALYNGKLYVSTNDRNYTGVLWETGDFGDSWKQVYEYREDLGSLPTFMQDIVVFNGKLYSWLMDDSHGAVNVGLVEYDENGGREIEPFGEGIRVTLSSFGVVGKNLYVCGEFGPLYIPKKNKALVLSVAPALRKRKSSKNPPEYGCCAFNGKTCEPIPFFNGESVDAFSSFGNLTVAAMYDYKSESGTLVATEDGSMWKELATLPHGVIGLSLAEFHGRLYIGTMPNGDVYVWENPK